MEERITTIIEKLNILIAAEYRTPANRIIDDPTFSNKVSLSDLNDFEVRIGTELPEEFREFLLHIGTRIGPDHGIFSRQKMIDIYNGWLEPLDENTKMSAPFALSTEDATELIELKIKLPNRSHYKPLPIINGILPLTTEGCTYYSYLVLNGEQKGKVWLLNTAVDFDTMPAGLVREFSFFDWYENWLDEKLSKIPAQVINTIKSELLSAKQPPAKKSFWRIWL
jgi:hypothetical protein